MVAVLHLRLVFVSEIAHVFVVQVDVNESAQLAIVCVEMLFQFGMGCGQLCQGIPDSSCLYVDRALLTSVLPQWSWNGNFHSVCRNSLFLDPTYPPATADGTGDLAIRYRGRCSPS